MPTKIMKLVQQHTWYLKTCWSAYLHKQAVPSIFYFTLESVCTKNGHRIYMYTLSSYKMLLLYKLSCEIVATEWLVRSNIFNNF